MPNSIVTLNVPSSSRLPDNGQWTNRFKIHSASSNRVYTIAQNKTHRHFGCSCPAWIYHRKCKHLTALGLPNHSVPVEVNMIAPAPVLAFANSNATTPTTPTRPIRHTRPTAPVSQYPSALAMIDE